MSELRALQGLTFVPPAQTRAPGGERPDLKWIPLSALRIDPRYQRKILDRGARNIRKILEHFDWTLFTPVICVEIEKARGGGHSGVYAIIDGQHRATAALMHPGIREVPCQVVKGDLSQQARAFVAINNQVTRLTLLQIHSASLAAGDGVAREIARCCQKAGATVASYPKPREQLQRGETLAIGTLRECVAKSGGTQTALALKALVDQDEPGNGLVNRDTIKGLLGAIAALGKWTHDAELFLSRMNGIDLNRLEDEAAMTALSQGGSVASHITRAVVDRLTALGFGPSASVPAKPAEARKAAPKRRGIGSY